MEIRWSLQGLENKIIGKINSSSNYSIKTLEEYSKRQLLGLFKSYSRQLNHIYGLQKNSALKVYNGWDRSCYILEFNDKPIGILVYKNDLLYEDSVIDTNHWYLEIKSFFLFDDFGEWHIWKLWDFFLSEVHKDYKNLDGLYVSVSKNKAKASLHMFKQMWFSPLYETYNKYLVDWDSEVFLFYPIWVNISSHYRSLIVSEPYFSQIKNGEKVVEGRVWKEFDHYKIWDVIVFHNKWETIQKQIKNIVKYNSLDEYLDNEWVGNCLPAFTKEEAIQRYDSTPWCGEEIQKYGITALRF